MGRVRLLGLFSKLCHLLVLFWGKLVYYSGHFFIKNVMEYRVEKYKLVLAPEMVQLFRHSSRVSLIACAGCQTLLVHLQRSGDVAVLHFRSGLVFSAVLQYVVVSAWGGIYLSITARPLRGVHVGQISSCCLQRVLLALIGKSASVWGVKHVECLLVIFGRVRFLTERFSRASCCLASALRHQLQESYQRASSSIYFSTWNAEVKERRFHPHLCWGIYVTNKLLGGKSSPWSAGRRDLWVVCQKRRKFWQWLRRQGVPMGLDVQEAATGSSSLQLNRLCAQLSQTVSQDLKRQCYIILLFSISDCCNVQFP